MKSHDVIRIDVSISIVSSLITLHQTIVLPLSDVAADRIVGDIGRNRKSARNFR